MHLTAQLLGGSGLEQGAWRLPQANPTAFADIDVVVQLAQQAERGGFDSVFFTDTPVLMPDLTTQKPGLWARPRGDPVGPGS